MSAVKEHFENEATEFDAIIRRLIPRYEEMLSALVSCISLPPDSAISVLDLGCGTGAVSLALLKRFPRARITLQDFSPRMLAIASARIPASNLDASVESDFNTWSPPAQYDAIVSSLALHHLPDDAAKAAFYRRLHAALNDGGAFLNADVVLASSDPVQQTYMARWREFMLRSTSEAEIENKWLPSYHAEDIPAPLDFHLASLRAAGFTAIDVYWKYFNFAVYGATKPA